MPSLPTHLQPRALKPVFSLAIPIVLANLSQPLVGTVDAVIAGHLTHAYQLGAVSLGTTLVTLCCWLFGFLKMSSSGFTAQADGRKDPQQVAAILAQGVSLALGISLLILLLSAWISSLGLSLLGARDQLAEQAALYFDIRIWAAPAILINYVFLGVLIGLGRVKEVLYAQLILNLSNLLLNAVLVFGLALEVKGLAIAALLAEYLAAAYGLYRLKAYFKPSAFQHGLSRQHLGLAMRVNRDLMLRTLLLQLVFTSFSAIGTRLGTDYLAANALLMSLLLLQAHALDGFSHAAEVLAGRAFGQGNWTAFHQKVQQSGVGAGVLAVALSGVFVLSAPWMSTLLTDQADTRIQLQAHYLWLAWIPASSVACFLLDGVFIGITQAHSLRNSMFFACVGFLALCSVLVPLYHNHGLWLSLHGFMLLRALGLYYAFRQLPKPTAH